MNVGIIKQEVVQEKEGEMRILSDVGGELEAKGDLRNYVCYYASGRLLVSQTHVNDTKVISYEALIKRLGRPVVRVMTDMEGIRNAYKNSNLREEQKADELTETVMNVRFSDLIEKAVGKKASDVHIRVSARYGTRIWFRVHGDMLIQEDQTEEYGKKLCSAIYMSISDVSDTAYKPQEHQDARISKLEDITNKLEGIRVATSPTVDGSMMVMRLLYNDENKSTDLLTLGWNQDQKIAVELMKSRPTGLNIVCGPTGSGKSTTLQRILTSLIAEKNQTINVITVEDPPEYPIPGANQTPVVATGEDRAKGFQKCITGAMRLDPDVIMISEVRDEASAQAAFRAAMTGHQVWTTLHANSAPAIIDRLIDIGIPLGLLADHTVLTGLICQRLVKIMCPHCRVPMRSKYEDLTQHDSGLLSRIISTVPNAAENVYFTGTGCDACANSGTKGRTALVEVIVPDRHFMDLIREGKKNDAIEHWKKAQKGSPLSMHAIKKVEQGLVDPRDAESVVGPLSLDSILEDGRLDRKEMMENMSVPVDRSSSMANTMSMNANGYGSDNMGFNRE